VQRAAAHPAIPLIPAIAAGMINPPSATLTGLYRVILASCVGQQLTLVFWGHHQAHSAHHLPYFLGS